MLTGSAYQVECPLCGVSRIVDYDSMHRDNLTNCEFGFKGYRCGRCNNDIRVMFVDGNAMTWAHKDAVIHPDLIYKNCNIEHNDMTFVIYAHMPLQADRDATYEYIQYQVHEARRSFNDAKIIIFVPEGYMSSRQWVGLADKLIVLPDNVFFNGPRAELPSIMAEEIVMSVRHEFIVNSWLAFYPAFDGDFNYLSLRDWGSERHGEIYNRDYVVGEFRLRASRNELEAAVNNTEIYIGVE